MGEHSAQGRHLGILQQRLARERLEFHVAEFLAHRLHGEGHRRTPKRRQLRHALHAPKHLAHDLEVALSPPRALSQKVR